MSYPADPAGSRKETSPAPGNVGTLGMGGRVCGEGLIFLTPGGQMHAWLEGVARDLAAAL